MLARILVSICLPALMAIANFAIAQEGVRREAAIVKLIEIQAEKAGALLDDRALEALILRFRKVNAGVSEETWRQIKSAVRLSFLRVLSESGGPFALSVREVMPQFTTDEIERLVAIHSDPLFIKYNDAGFAVMRKPNVELALRIAIERSVVEMNDLVIKRGMNPAY